MEYRNRGDAEEMHAEDAERFYKKNDFYVVIVTIFPELFID